MEGRGGEEFLAIFNGVGFRLNDLVDVFVGTGKGVKGSKAFPIKGRFKGVRVEKGEERFLCRPIVGSQKGRCPSFPRESCLKVKAFGSDVYGERKPLYFSKLSTKMQERSAQPPPTPLCAPLSLSSLTQARLSQSLLSQANVDAIVRQQKAVKSLHNVRTKAAQQLRERYQI